MTNVQTKNWPLLVCLSVLAIVVIACVTALNYKVEIANYIWPERLEVVQPDSVVADPPLTIYDVVSLRRDILNSRKIDSIYMSISDTELTAILMKIGTNSTPTEVVEAYPRLKPYLKDVLIGEAIAKNILQEDAKRQPLDTVPIRPIPVAPLPLP